MAVVTVNSGESIESALRRFKRKVMTEEIIKDAKKHAFFMPPGQKAKLNLLWLESGTRRKAARGHAPSAPNPSCALKPEPQPVVHNRP
jgi:small subunit ribosomal protein S21